MGRGSPRLISRASSIPSSPRAPRGAASGSPSVRASSASTVARSRSRALSAKGPPSRSTYPWRNDMDTDVATPVKQSAGVLVVDDERTLRFTLSESLSEDGYRVETASDGAEALERIDRGDFPLVLLDQKLPDMNGIEVLRKI